LQTGVVTLVVEPYRERPALVPGAAVWTRTAEGGDYRVLPDGCMDVILMDDDLTVAGPDSRAWTGTAEAGTRYAGIRFAPGAAPGFLGVPARDLLNERVSLSELWSPARSRRLLDRVRSAPDPAVALDEEVARLVDAPPDRLISHVLRSIRSGMLRGSAGVMNLAGSVGLSERQLHRRCLNAFGYGPKMLDRVLRMNLALDRARTGEALADVAVLTGYADQAHLTRDVKALTGLPPRILLG
jgi:AraC-like DNA-binding protein